MTTLYLTPGDDFVYIATVTDDDGAAYSLVGTTLWFTAKRRISDPDADAIAALYWVSGGASDGISVTAPSSGVAEIAIDTTGTLDFVQAAHRWDLQIEGTDGKRRTVDSGVLVIRPGVTTRVTTTPDP